MAENVVVGELRLRSLGDPINCPPPRAAAANSSKPRIPRRNSRPRRGGIASPALIGGFAGVVCSLAFGHHGGPWSRGLHQRPRCSRRGRATFGPRDESWVQTERNEARPEATQIRQQRRIRSGRTTYFRQGGASGGNSPRRPSQQLGFAGASRMAIEALVWSLAVPATRYSRPRSREPVLMRAQQPVAVA